MQYASAKRITGTGLPFGCFAANIAMLMCTLRFECTDILFYIISSCDSNLHWVQSGIQDVHSWCRHSDAWWILIFLFYSTTTVPCMWWKQLGVAVEPRSVCRVLIERSIRIIMYSSCHLCHLLSLSYTLFYPSIFDCCINDYWLWL